MTRGKVQNSPKATKKRSVKKAQTVTGTKRKKKDDVFANDTVKTASETSAGINVLLNVCLTNSRLVLVMLVTCCCIYNGLWFGGGLGTYVYTHTHGQQDGIQSLLSLIPYQTIVTPPFLTTTHYCTVTGVAVLVVWRSASHRGNLEGQSSSHHWHVQMRELSLHI